MAKIPTKAVKPDEEPVRVRKHRRTGGPRSIGGPVSVTVGMASRNVLILILVALVILFTLLLPGTFLTGTNITSTLATQAVGALVALGVLVPLVCNEFDLSVGYMVGAVNIFAIGLQTESHIPWVAVVVVVLAVALGAGAINGLIVTRLRVNSFITTLGSGSILYAIGLWYSNGEQLIGSLPRGFKTLGGTVGNIPLPAVYVVIAALTLWVMLDYLPSGRQLYVLGASRKTAELLGIRTGKYIVVAFMASAFLSAVGGVVLASQLLEGQSATGPEYLLPAFAAVFLGATSVRPGSVNVWGTVWAVLVVAVFITGLTELGQSYWVEPFFDGILVIVAVAGAGFFLRKRAASARAADVAERVNVARAIIMDRDAETESVVAEGGEGTHGQS